MSDPHATAGNGAVLAPLIKGRFRVVGTTSSSPEAVVYSAEDLTTGGLVTLEVLRSELAIDPSFAAAVREQAYRLAKPECAHRTLVRVHECDVTDEGEMYVVLERVDGRSLREVMDDRGPLDQHSALRLAIQVGEALETLHHCGIVHGEVRPESIVLLKGDDGGDSIKLAGTELTTARRTPVGLRSRDDSVSAYLAPEQINGGATTEVTDVHGLGLLIRELLTGERPSPKPSRAGRDLPPAVSRIIDKALAVRPDERYQNLSVMLNDMWSAQSAPPKAGVTERLGVRRSRGINGPQPRIGAVVMVLAGVASLAVGAWIGLSGQLGPIATPSPGPSRASAPVTVPIPPPLPVETAPAEPRTPSTPAAVSVEATAQKPPAKPSLPSVDRATPPSAATERPIMAAPKTPAVLSPAPSITQEKTAGTPARPRRVETREAEPQSSPAAQRGAEARSEPGDGAAVIDWLLKDRRSD